MPIFNVQLVRDQSVIEIDADGFKTTDNGCLVFYQSDDKSDRNSTIFVAGPGRWDYFEAVV